jgi:opacity protein-like surface antigen
MKLLRVFVVIVLILITYTESYSQSRYNFHIGPSFPLSKIDLYGFGFNEYEVYSSARTGINIGFQYSYQIANSGIGLFAGIDFLYNGVIKEYKDSVEHYLTIIGYESIEFPKYYNIPISTGIEYVLKTGGKLSLFSNIGITYNFFKASDQIRDDLVNETDWSNSLGFRAALGVLFKQKASISIDYLGLGEHEIKSRLVSSGSGEMEYDTKTTINMLTLTFGWNF